MAKRTLKDLKVGDEAALWHGRGGYWERVTVTNVTPLFVVIRGGDRFRKVGGFGPKNSGLSLSVLDAANETTMRAAEARRAKNAESAKNAAEQRQRDQAAFFAAYAREVYNSPRAYAETIIRQACEKFAAGILTPFEDKELAPNV